jgi:hypothetical protein
VGPSLLLAFFAILVAFAAVYVSNRQRAPKTPEIAADDDDTIDRKALEDAEREVRGMEGDLRGKPTDDVVGDDWGPGSPRPPFA